MIRPISLSVATLLAVALPSFAFAQAGLSGIHRSVMALDKNFDVADKNRDGKLSKEEAQAGPVAFIATNFDAIDKSHTGFVTKSDVHAYIAAMLMRSQPKPPAGTPEQP
ncbi:EF-hand domain-containing protein [Luteibacter yeojuensis]|uniref:EF-hand domain-containing protein n=1 Tax=Luteibacter yeojuensis TaxID=345309 RepID=UPI003084011F